MRCPRRRAPRCELADLLERRWAPRCRAVRRDPIGNVVARVGGSGPRVLLQAHMDQVGYVVRHVTDDGFLLLDTRPGRPPDRAGAPAPGRAAGPRAHAATATWLDGLIAAASGHVLTAEQRESTSSASTTSGSSSGSAPRRACSTPACTSARRSSSPRPTRALGELLVGPAMDNRVGLALMDALIDVADELACELWLGATVQEENGLHGARALALAERFDAAIALDVGLVGDIPAVDETRVRDPPRRRPDRRPPRHRDHLRPHAHPAPAGARPRAGIPAQDGLFAGYGSDGLALAETGSPTALLTVATRYTHTAFETIHTGDLAATVALLRAFVTSAAASARLTIASGSAPARTGPRGGRARRSPGRDRRGGRSPTRRPRPWSSQRPSLAHAHARQAARTACAAS